MLDQIDILNAGSDWYTYYVFEYQIDTIIPSAASLDWSTHY
jgi:hypothetical protein